MKISASKSATSPSCKTKTDTVKSTIDTTLVPVATVRLGTFYSQIWCNGVLEAAEKVVVAFQAQGNIVDLLVNNGQYVNSGQLLARVDDSRQKMELIQADLVYMKALIELEDLLLRLHHSLNDTTVIPLPIWSMAKLRSGYDDARLQLARARYDLGLTCLKAPISGIITGLEAQRFAPVSAYKSLCTIINSRRMYATFSLLESDAGLIKPGITGQGISPCHQR